MRALLGVWETTVQRLEKLKWLPPLMARVTVGFVFIETGWGKIHNIQKVIGFFTSLGIPAPEFQARLVAGTEFTCGLLMLAGLFTRLASIPLTVIMVVAIYTAKRTELEGVTNLFGLSEYLYIVLLVWLLITGAGSFSLDRLLAKKWKSY